MSRLALLGACWCRYHLPLAARLGS